MLRAAAVALLAVTAACDDSRPRQEICANGLDDDGDQLTDCMDIECTSSPSCRIRSDGDADADAEPDSSGDESTEPDAEHDARIDEDAGGDADRDVRPDASPTAVCNPTAGEERYAFVLDAQDTCVVRRPVWQQLYWSSVTPAGTSIEFLGRTAESEGELASATEFQVALTPPASSPADIDATLASAGIPNGQRLLQVMAVLRCPDAAEPAQLVDVVVLHGCD